MNTQSKVLETTANIRNCATSFAHAAAQAVGGTRTLKTSLATLRVAGSEFNKVARLHVSRFMKENSAIARAAGKDVGELARSTFSQLVKVPAAPMRKARKTAAPRKRAAKAG